MWLRAARSPRAERPLLITRTGVRSVTSRAASRNRRPSARLSMYSRMTFVRGSSPRARSRSLSSTPARLPTDRNREKPSRSDRPYLRIPAQSAPLWETKAMFPGGGSASEKVALKETSGSVLRTPKQFGPMIDIRYRWTRARRSASSATPAPPTSLNPAEITTRPRVPARPSSSTTPPTFAAGTMTIPSSGASGSEATSG